jgi:hypothetical protein
VTVAEWIQRRSAEVPETLRTEVLDALGVEGRSDERETPQICLRASRRVLETLLRDRAFTRDSAIELLAADALATFAFEYAAEHAWSATELSGLAHRGAGDLGELVAHR